MDGSQVDHGNDAREQNKVEGCGIQPEILPEGPSDACSEGDDRQICPEERGNGEEEKRRQERMQKSPFRMRRHRQDENGE